MPLDQLKWTLMQVLRRLLDEGRTLALPTFTFSFCKGRSFHRLRSPSETGLLGDWFLEMTGTLRTPHPLYSFAVAGPLADQIIACPTTTTFGVDSPLALFERENARIVMFGCGWELYCTQFHRYEEEAEVPYRYFKDFSGEADYGGGEKTVRARMYVRDPDVAEENDFSPVVRLLRDAGSLLHVDLAQGHVESVTCYDLGRACRKLLAQDPYVFMSHAPEVRYRVENKNDRASKDALRIALLGMSNLEFLKSALLRRMGILLPDRRIEVYICPFAQAYQEILAPESGLRRVRPDCVFFCDRLEDVLKVDDLSCMALSDEEPLEVYLEMIRRWSDGYEGTTFVNRFLNFRPPALGAADATSKSSVGAWIRSANRRLESELTSLDNVYPFDLQAVAQGFEGGAVFDPRTWYLGRIPYSNGFTDYLAGRYAAMVLDVVGRSARLLVVDLDNTLWAGILGEDGLEGLALGGDYPGNAHVHFQKVLMKLMDRGLALAIVSKNDEEHALHAINTLSDMEIREKHLAAFRINWKEKWRNVIEISEEIGLGLENVVFVDDNPVERDQMRKYLPAVKVVDLPEDPAFYAKSLLESPFLECVSLTEEDRKRSQRYVSKRRLEKVRQQFVDPEDFFASLQPKLHVASLHAGNIARATQLVNKTNQFNATTKRYSRNELSSLERDEGNDVFVIGLEDRFSEFENIGVAVVRWHHPEPGVALIDLLLLSCRVLGRGVEGGFLAWLARRAKERGLRTLIGVIIPSKRNTPVRDVFQKHHFLEGSEQGSWVLALDGAIPRLPDWISVVEHTKELDDVGRA